MARKRDAKSDTFSWERNALTTLLFVNLRGCSRHKPEVKVLQEKSTTSISRFIVRVKQDTAMLYSPDLRSRVANAVVLFFFCQEIHQGKVVTRRR